jgi:hypothetical protein
VTSELHRVKPHVSECAGLSHGSSTDSNLGPCSCHQDTLPIDQGGYPWLMCIHLQGFIYPYQKVLVAQGGGWHHYVLRIFNVYKKSSVLETRLIACEYSDPTDTGTFPPAQLASNRYTRSRQPLPPPPSQKVTSTSCD